MTATSTPIDIATYLHMQGVGILGSTVFYGLQPTSPDDCVTVYEYGGPPPEIVGNVEHPMIQVRIRNKSFQTGSLKAREVLTTLHNAHEKTINSVHYLFITGNQSPEHLGQDNNHRHEWVVNFHVMRDLT